MKNEISNADRLVERVPQFDEREEKVGERSVVELKNKPSGSRTAMLWIENTDFYALEADSLHHILEFEKWLKLPNKASPEISLDASRAITFEPLETTGGTTEDGTKFSEHRYKSTGCVTVTHRTEFYASVEASSRQWQEYLSSATEVKDRAPKLNLNEKQVGEKALLVFAPIPTSEYQHQYALLWTEHSQLHLMKSPSLKHTLALEEKLLSP